MHSAVSSSHLEQAATPPRQHGRLLHCSRTILDLTCAHGLSSDSNWAAWQATLEAAINELTSVPATLEVGLTVATGLLDRSFLAIGDHPDLDSTFVDSVCPQRMLDP